MKKQYDTPTAEKIAFRYRDQVVAASGDPVSQAIEQDIGTNYNNSFGQCFTAGELIDDIRNMTLWELCSRYA